MPSEAIAALLQNTIGRRRTRSATASTAPVAGSTRSTPAVGVADQQPAVEVELEPERAAAGVGDPVDAPRRRG